MLKVKMIGTGSAFSKKFGNTSALVEFPTGYNLLLDCGHTVPKGLHDLGIGLGQVDGIFISHLHADHVGGLEEVALYNKFVLGGRKIDLLVPLPLVTPLWDNCLDAGLRSNGSGLSDYFNVQVIYDYDRSPMITTIDYHEIKIFETNHVPNMRSFAIGIGKDLFYSADTVFDSKLIKGAYARYDTIFHDCQMTPKSPNNVHASIEEMMTLHKEIQAQTYLMHYGDNVEEFKNNTGYMKIAEQGWTYIVGGEINE